MLYRPSSFRKSSRAVTLAAVAGLFVSASGMATSSARADETNNKYIAACAHLKDSTPEHAGCIYSQMERQTRDLKQDTARLKVQEKALDKSVKVEDLLKECLVSLAAFKKNSPADFDKLGTITRENACSVAGKLPKPTASAAKPTAG